MQFILRTTRNTIIGFTLHRANVCHVSSFASIYLKACSRHPEATVLYFYREEDSHTYALHDMPFLHNHYLLLSPNKCCLPQIIALIAFCIQILVLAGRIIYNVIFVLRFCVNFFIVFLLFLGMICRRVLGRIFSYFNSSPVLKHNIGYTIFFAYL